ncbi:MAG: HAMP domain-containing protein [candidate division Zixibacteria bacterium]|nr:HAMP domain-containing protein [candidate division Zixibacteria bacterium]
MVAIVGGTLFALAATGLIQYFNEVSARRAHIIEKSEISLAPITTLATRNVNGGNLMNLQNTAALDLYKTNPDLLFLKVEGMSAGSPKTDYSEEIPPAKIEYTYINPVFPVDENAGIIKMMEGFTGNNTHVEERKMALLIHRDLQVKNGGDVQAIFSAKALDGVGMMVVKQLLGVFVIALGVALIIAIIAGNRISRPILDIVGQVSEFTSTLDLGYRVNVNTKNEIGDLAERFNHHIESLERVIANASGMTDKVNGSANDIAASVEEQAAITAEQSASLTEITATMEELSVSSSQIADNANAVASTSKNTLSESERGVVALNRLKEKMDEITADNNKNINEILDLDRKSKEIGKIMGIINDIADQTKMIAFNAAIEASSSGEAGKRFSVVAVEIRRLADNVMESTGEIESKIEEIQKAINRLVIASEKGSKAINDGSQAASGTLDELMRIVDGAKTASESAMQISLSTQQQKTASSQVLTALTEIDQGLHQSSASIRQTSTATISLKSMSDDLKDRLEVFKISTNGHGRA